MRKWLVLGLFATIGCAKGPSKIACHEKCSFESVVRVDPAFSPPERKEVWRGLNAWAAATPGVCFRPQRGTEGYHLTIIRGETQESLRPFTDAYQTSSAIQKDQVIVIAMDKARPQLADVAAHEAGHLLGMSHLPTKEAVMAQSAGALVEGRLTSTDLQEFNRNRCH